ncbi:MAG: hypothetical protein B7Y80_20855 [Hyphomicrobium sp. 32-62-53]|nr:MAG: hypothetical protein B7Y80_20855 [Hyphomicrobium sp. 32-62-53]
MAKSPFRPATTQPIYPVGGMASWLKSMERHASHLGITIEKHRTIVSVRETSDGVEIIDAEGKRDSARRLVLSGRTLLDQIELQNGTFDLEPIEIESHHYSLAIKNQAPSGLVHYLGHPKLFLVNDVTRFAPAQFEEQYPGHRLIVARTVYRSGPKPTGAEVVEALKETEYLSNAAISNAENHWHLRQRFLSRNCLRALQNRMPTKVSVLSTADLDIVGAAARMMLAKP